MKLKYFYLPELKFEATGYGGDYYSTDLKPVLHQSEDGLNWVPVESEEFPSVERQKELIKIHEPGECSHAIDEKGS